MEPQTTPQHRQVPVEELQADLNRVCGAFSCKPGGRAASSMVRSLTAAPALSTRPPLFLIHRPSCGMHGLSGRHRASISS